MTKCQECNMKQDMCSCGDVHETCGKVYRDCKCPPESMLIEIATVKRYKKDLRDLTARFVDVYRKLLLADAEILRLRFEIRKLIDGSKVEKPIV